MRGDLHINDRSIFLPVSPSARPINAGGRVRHTLQQSRDVLSRTYISDGHGEKLRTSISVMENGGLVDGKESEGFEVIDPHRKRVAFKQEAVSFPRLAQSHFRQLVLADLFFQFMVDGCELCRALCDAL